MKIFNATQFGIVSLCLMAIAACTPNYVNTEDLGAPATADEITSHYSGNSIRYAQEHGGPLNTEAYFAPDGTYKLVFLDDPIISLGTWQVGTGLLPTLNIEADDYLVNGGTVDRRSNGVQSFTIYIQGDGGANADMLGGGNFDQPRPVHGFRSEGRWNALARQAGL